jgi:K+-sensing histidine kinase KdpD
VVNINQNTGIERANLKFEDVLQYLMYSISTQITATEAEVTYNFSECSIIEYPKVYLESIMLNLLTNAIKYRSPDRVPQIYFETRNNNGKTMLICQDNGLGINMEQNGHKLFGLHKTFHRNPDARGVGLFITKNQIEAMGGSIFAQSEVNKGTTFTIIFNDKKYEQDD